jgi:uncharacterized membrane protein YeaQ/YmgE (transglycosylase-associated protein family)
MGALYRRLIGAPTRVSSALSDTPDLADDNPIIGSKTDREYAKEKINVGAFSWIIVGLIAGFISSKIVNRSGEGFLRDVLLGILGALFGGFIFQRLGYSGVNGINLYSILVAVVGAVILLVIFHAIRGGQKAGA